MGRVARFTSLVAAFVLSAAVLPATLSAAPETTTYGRIAGSTRVETAIEISKAGWTSASTVVLVAADQANLIDALAVAPLAGQEDAPVLMTGRAALAPAVKARIAELGATDVYVVGALTDSVIDEVAGIDGVTVTELRGANRWATAALINAELVAPAGTFVMGANALPDGISVASYAARNGFAIMLAATDGTLPAGQSVAGDDVYMLGGTTLVKDIPGAVRIAGADRFATNAAIADTLDYEMSDVYVANGFTLVDGLAAGPLAAQTGSFVALSTMTDVDAADVVNPLLDLPANVVALGGTGAVPDATRGLLRAQSRNFSVAFVDWDGTQIGETQSVGWMTGATAPTDPTREGYTFTGWDTDFSAITADTTVTAEYELITTAYVADLTELKAALANTDMTSIIFTADIDTAEKIVVNRAVAIDGAGFALNFTGDVAGWGSNYVVQVYRTAGVSFADITISGGDAALLVNGSEVELLGTVDVSGNEFGGIESSMGSGVTEIPVLDVTGATLVNDSEAYGRPTLWEDGVSGTVTGFTGLESDEVRAGQVQYYIGQDAQVSTLAQLKGALANTDIVSIVFTGDIDTAEKIVVNRAVAIDGAGFALTVTANLGTDNSSKQALGLYAGTAATPIQVSNLTIDSASLAYGVNTYNNAYVVLDGVTIVNSKGAALIVNGSTVTATALSTSGNAWGAVNVDPGSGVNTPSVFTLVSGNLAEAGKIWSDGTYVTASATVTVNADGYTEQSGGGTLRYWIPTP